ncbi:DNA repair protein RecN (Recombination protein N) [Ruminiclostridium sufflavum DSM 19573]|uniref:DNA repair protein RecN n=1 Tax=Ruminiclostridium sufflavum DSM 19573 TaxID=1121337 RepID=A0A318XMF5_9FIRM|nr:DNA repair protein RecN [Ruminiclostridium sufflavum]PYG86829.1 DNA repair protein RecN (Recombination protein N) [Ruminiclostridium sufflavum DSM 19573]
MLLQLDIQNIALIDKLSLEIAPGLNVLTGETGAGKSIIIDSINAILGERINRDIIRNGKEKAFIEAVFDYDDTYINDILEQLGIEAEDGNLIISREISLSGKNTCRINGRLVNVSALKQVGELLIDIHGQHDNQSLLKTDTHIKLLDAFGGEAVQKCKTEYSEVYGEYKSIKSRIQGLAGDKGEIARRMDMLKYQIDEIKGAKLKRGEDEKLNKQRQLLANSEKIMSSVIEAYGLLNEDINGKSAMYNLNNALRELSGICRYDEDMVPVSEKLESVIFQLEDICSDILAKRDSADFDPEELSRIDERIDIIASLKRKYGSTLEEIIEFYGKSKKEYDELLQSESLIEELNDKLSEIVQKLYEGSKRLHLERQRAAAVLEKNITEELENLEMKNSEFKVNLIYSDNQNSFTKNGLNTVEFLISSNIGEPLKPLNKIASGGEMSRIMLAIKTILANVDSIPTLIFDEIDTGISGKAAQKVGEKLSYISKNHQVLCVTHLSQLACMADNHLFIEKKSNDENTFTTVRYLDQKGRIEEIARIIGGSDITTLAVKHAEELINSAVIFKSKN